MSRIMIIAGGDWQCPIVKTAKSMGHEVVCSNLYENSPAFRYADFGEVANVLDKEKNLDIACKYKPDAVLTDQSDIAVPTVAYVAEKLGLRGIGKEKAELFTNKYKMREFCKKNGFAYPAYKLCHSLDEAVSFWRSLGKAIIKPLDSQSSRGIFIIDSEDELRSHYDEALSYSNSEKAILVEQYIEGKEFTVDGIKTSDQYIVTAISKKNHFSYNPSIAQELLFTNYDDEYDYDKLREINTQMVEKMELPFGLTHAEYKYMDGMFYLIEIAARGGGTKISSDIVPVMSNINSNEILIRELLGEKPQIQMHMDKERCAVLGFFDFKSGRVKAVNGLENAKKLPGVIDIGLNFKSGDIIENAKDDRSRVGYYILEASSVEKLRDVEKCMKEILKIVYED